MNSTILQCSAMLFGLLLIGSDVSAADTSGDGFRRIATFSSYANNADIADETAAEIIAATSTGTLLVYTDGKLNQIGFIDIADPKLPQAGGKLDVGGEPTSVAILGERYALVAVNSSESLQLPSGHLSVVDLVTRKVVHEIDLGGQPDSIAVAPSGRFAAIAIENERDESIDVDGVAGGLPQLPAGYLSIVDLEGVPNSWTQRVVSLAGYSAYAPTDPEPEFVSINSADEVVITLQENNHALIVDLPSGQIRSDIALGTVDLHGIDAIEDDVISLTDSLLNVPREPDSVTWLPGGKTFAIANEGDLQGGSRGFSIFTANGKLRYDSGTAFEALAVQHGHYPEHRSEDKGSEPEAISYGKYGEDHLLFVGSERGNFVAVYTLAGRDFSQPTFRQFLAAPRGPEGVLTIPKRNLLVVAGELDDPKYGVRSSVMIYEYASVKKQKATQSVNHSAAQHLTIASRESRTAQPISWSSLSGLAASGGRRMLAVNDGHYADSSIFELSRRGNRVAVRSKTAIHGASGAIDPEGIALGRDGMYWIASEGNRSGSRPNTLLHVDYKGVVAQEIALPKVITKCRAASKNSNSHGGGFEGVTVLPSEAGELVLVAQQRGWEYTTKECAALDDSRFGVDGNEPLATRLWTYSVATAEWDHIVYELAAIPPHAKWVGLSEVSALPNGDLLLIERDNLSGDFAQLKTVVRVSAEALADGVIKATEKQVFDLLPSMRSGNGWVSNKPEGLTVIKGEVLVVTDNNGLDDWSGETTMLSLGTLSELFPQPIKP